MKRNLIIVVVLMAFRLAAGQTTEFTYQGRLMDGSLPANGSYDLEFKLFDVEAAGTELGLLQRLTVPVSNGAFTVTLDFGNQFNGGPRFLEIAVRPAGSGNFTILTPRQRVTSVPHNIRSLSAANADNAAAAMNAAQLGGIAADQYVVTSDPRMSDARNPLAGSGSYIQNTNAQQAAANFNISGNGTLAGMLSANAVTAATQFNIGINRALALGSSSVFVGRLAGASIVAGSGNTFVGESAGRFTTTASNNSFFGREAGLNNAGGNNSFFGVFAGSTNSTGEDNSFFGSQAGTGNTTGVNNSFFGRRAGLSNDSANNNSFFGFEAGMSNRNAGGNSFFGSRAGRLNTALFNSFFGSGAGAENISGDRNSFFGWNAGASNTASNNSFFGMQAGISNTTGAANSFFGESSGEDNTTGSRNTFIGRWAGNSNTTGADNTFLGFNAVLLNTTGTKNVFIGLFAGSFDNGDNLTIIGSNAGVPNGLTLQYATAIGADAEVSSSNTVQLGRANGFDTVFAPGLIRVNGLGVSGSTNLCRNASNIISTCSSSLRYKDDIKPYLDGYEVIRKLSPIAFTWKDGGMIDVGFAAEDVARIEPLLATQNASGQVEGVKYGQITTVLVNAVKEQQKIIEKQQKQIDELKAAVCSLKPESTLCITEEKK